MQIKISLDTMRYSGKPDKKKITEINQRIANSSRELEVKEIAELVGNKGHTFCPAVFSEGKRKKENFLQMQLFGLDFDTGISLDIVRGVANEYGLSIAFAYQTFSSTKDNQRFRIVFVNDVPVTDSRAAEIMLKMLLMIFPDADKSCKDVSRMFFGGKGLLTEINEETINIVQLKDAFQEHEFKKGEKNYSRNIQQFAKENNIMCINDVLQIERTYEDSKIEEKTDFHPYIYTSFTVFSSNKQNYVIHKGYKKNVHINKQGSMAVRVLKTDMEKKCKLYHDFKESSHIHHNERFLLMTNMLHIKGGIKEFISIIKEKGYDEKKWRFYIKYAKDNQYKPQSCAGNCPYAEVCDHKTTMLVTVKEKDKIIKLSEEESYDTVDEVYNYVAECLEKSVRFTGHGIVIIPAQTAIGKTEAYCNLIQNHSEQNFIVAVPTNRLKHEVYQRLRRKGVEAYKTLSLHDRELSQELSDKIQRYYRLGLEKEIVNLLREYIRENKESESKDIIADVSFCKAYVQQTDKLIESKVIVTTHKKLSLLSNEITKNYCIIVDEDILSTFYKNIQSVSMEAVSKVKRSPYCPQRLKDKLCLAENMKDGEFRSLNADIAANGLSEEELKELNIDDNINGISYASVCCKKGGDLHYFCPSDLPEEKVIVLSATVNAELYRKYFKRRNIIEYSYKKSRYKGTLTQMTAHSMSRQCIQNNKEKLKVYLEPLKKEYKMITFKKYEKELNAVGLHFGNAEGIDDLNGKNVLIVGTPHLDEMVYKLIGYHLGMDVAQESLAVRKVRCNGFEFNLMTYGEEEFKNLQIYFINKELEQCIGRARLLRNDCKVLVLSNFPCEQAELVQENYLKEEQ